MKNKIVIIRIFGIGVGLILAHIIWSNYFDDCVVIDFTWRIKKYAKII